MKYDMKNPPTEEEINTMGPEEKRELLAAIEAHLQVMLHRILAQHDMMKREGRDMPTPEEFAAAALGRGLWAPQ
jgi:hypothetical protein